MEKPETNQTLEQDPFVKELFDVLKKYNPPGMEDIQDMIANAAKIEQQITAALAAVTAMRSELAVFIKDNNHPIRNTLQNAINVIQGQIRQLREQFETLKTNIIEGCKNVLAAFKDRGVSALSGITKYFNVKPALEAIAKTCDQAAKDNTKTINKIERISKEYHKTGQHFKNIGRVITGKELLTTMKPVGKVAKTVEAPVKAVRACNLVIRNAARDIAKSLSRLEKAADRPKPIKEQLETATKQAAEHNARITPEKAKTTRAVEL